MTLKDAKREAEKNLSEKRLLHTANVAAAASALAVCHGEDPEKAELAGWLHDIVKEKSQEALLQLMAQDVIMSGSTVQRPYPVWHGPCGAIYAKHQLGVSDEAVLCAISCHTTGKVGMSLLDKILFLADATCDERSFPGVGHIRALAKTDIDAAVVETMKENIAYLKRVGKKLDIETVQALSALCAQAAQSAHLELEPCP